MAWEKKEITLVVYDVDGNEHVMTIDKQEAVGIIRSLAESI